MTIIDYYKKLEEAPNSLSFVKQVMNACGVDRSTVSRWVRGKATPDKLKREKIAEIAGLPVETLFPTIKD